MKTTWLVAIVGPTLALLVGCGVGVLESGEDEDGLALAPDEELAAEERDTQSLLDDEELPPLEEGDRGAFASLPALLDTEELAFLKRINDYRAANGRGRLRVSIALTRASIFHSTDMAQKSYFSHTSADGTSFSVRVKRFYNYNTYLGENLARGYPTGDSVFEGWRGSPGHNANMLSASYTVIGIARVANPAGVYYWTTDFGGKTDALLSAGLSTLIANPGFESPGNVTANVAFYNVRTLGRWHTHASSGGSSSVRAGSASSGSYGLRQVDPDPGAVSGTQLVLAAPSVNYRLAVSARRLAGSTQQAAYLDFINSSFARIKVVTVPAGTSSTWQTVSVGEVAPAGTRYVRVILWGHSTAGHRSTFDFDVVRLEAF